MGKPTEVIEQYQHPRGTTITWDDIGDPVSLRFMHRPTIVISGVVTEPIAFMGSIDGNNYELLRDDDGDVIRYVKPGVYVLKHEVRFIKPTYGKDFKGTIQLFIEG